MPDALAPRDHDEGAHRSERTRVHRLVFTGPEETIQAVQRLRREGFCVGDVHTPFPVHGLPEAMGLADTRLGWATFVGGATGGVASAPLRGSSRTSACKSVPSRSAKPGG